MILEDNIETCLRETECEGLDCIQMVQGNPMVSFCEYGNECSGSTKGGYFSDQLSNCRLFKKAHTTL